ncbi:MAG: acyltransferase [Acidobacteria bacterium]|nr:acyltransferase [Acidobacteriota bacterium]
MDRNSSNLDLLRSIAVLAVYFSHVSQMLKVESVGPISVNAFAQMGVLAFFVHTSLVLMFSMDRLQMPAAAMFKAFYVRRAFRIYPLSIVTVAATVVFSIPAVAWKEYVPLGRLDLVSNLLITQNLTFSPEALGVLWSLPLEVQMYVILPVLYLAVRRWPYWWLPVGLWVLAVVAAPIQAKTISRLSVLQYGPCFLGGVLCYVLCKYRRYSFPSWGWPAIILAAFGIRQLGVSAGWVACLLLGAALPHIQEVQQPWIKTAAAWIAKYSYGIYLSHLIVLWTAFVVLEAWPLWGQILVCVSLSVALPMAMFHWIEQPMMAVGAQLARRTAPPVPQPWTDDARHLQPLAQTAVQFKDKAMSSLTMNAKA